MPIEIVMPKLGVTMTEGLILEWKGNEGDQVKAEDVLFVMASEKVTFDVQAQRGRRAGGNHDSRIQELAHAIHPHPSVSEAMMEAALSLAGGSIHMP